jgi:HflC protein
MKKTVWIIIVATVLLLAVLLVYCFLSIFVIEPGNHAVVTRRGVIVRVHSEPGLHFKEELLEEVHYIPARIFSFTYVNKIPTRDKMFLEVETLYQWSIDDPEAYYKHVHHIDRAKRMVENIILTYVRAVISTNELKNLVPHKKGVHLLKERSYPEIENKITKKTQSKLKGYGIKLWTVRMLASGAR